MCAKQVRRNAKKSNSSAVTGANTSSPARSKVDAEALQRHASDRWEAGDRRGALADLEAAAMLAANDASIRYDLGYVVMAMGNKRLASQHFTHVLLIDPAHVDAMIMRGVCADMLGAYQAALVDFSSAIALKPDDADAWNSRGIVLRHLGKSRKAMLNYNRSIELDPASAKFYFNRALLHEEFGDLGRARADLAQSQKLDPGHVGAKRALKRLAEVKKETAAPSGRRRPARDRGGRLRGRVRGASPQ